MCLLLVYQLISNRVLELRTNFGNRRFIIGSNGLLLVGYVISPPLGVSTARDKKCNAEKC